MKNFMEELEEIAFSVLSMKNIRKYKNFH